MDWRKAGRRGGRERGEGELGGLSGKREENGTKKVGTKIRKEGNGVGGESEGG